MAKQFFQKSKKASIITKSLEEKKAISIKNTEIKGNFKISLSHLDKEQKFGSGYADWQKAGLLSKFFETFQGYCCRPLLSQVDGDKFTIYGDFPKKDYTEFKYPEHVPEDANWARIHINGVSVVAGHIVEDTFYVVFLDKTHSFYLTKKRRGEK